MGHLRKIEDCRLFNFDDIVFVNCASYEDTERFEWIPRSYIGALLWKQNDKNEIVAYLEAANPDNNVDYKMLQTKQLYYRPHDIAFGFQPKNLIALQYKNELYFQWELTHSYFIRVDMLNDSESSNGLRIGQYAFHNEQAFASKHNLTNPVEETWGSYHLNNGFIHLEQSREFLGIAHAHYDLYDYNTQWHRPFGIQHGYHYTHFFFTIEDEPPFKVKRMTEEFCFVSQHLNDNKTDCEIVQFVAGMVENIVNGKEVLFVSYGINDCTSAIAQINKQSVINMLEPVSY